MAKVLIIKDGHTRAATFKPQGDVGQVVFKYRPALPERVYDYFNADKGTTKLQMREVTLLLLAHLVAWDIDDMAREGLVAPIDQETLYCVPHPVLMYMVNRICGYGPVDAAEDVKN